MTHDGRRARRVRARLPAVAALVSGRSIVDAMVVAVRAHACEAKKPVSIAVEGHGRG